MQLINLPLRKDDLIEQGNNSFYRDQSGKRAVKNEVPEARVIDGHGIENDGHGGDWGRQVTCLNWQSVLKANQEHNLNIGPGQFAENIAIDGMDFSRLTVGSRFKLGENVIFEVSQVGKEDHPSVVTRTYGVSLLPSEGLFCRVISGGVFIKGTRWNRCRILMTACSPGWSFKWQ